MASEQEVADVVVPRQSVAPSTSTADAQASWATDLGAHYQRLIRLAGVICRQPVDAEDAVQAALERAWQHRERLRDSTSATAWLNQIVVREAIRIEQRRRTWLGRLLSGPREIEAPPSAGDLGSDRWLADRALRAAFDELPVEQRAALALHHYVGYSVAEAADIMAVPLETARSRLRLGRERLRRELAEGDR
jgi:RNA polymerase sigma factor (sigma-70 family)